MRLAFWALRFVSRGCDGACAGEPTRRERSTSRLLERMIVSPSYDLGKRTPCVQDLNLSLKVALERRTQAWLGAVDALFSTQDACQDWRGTLSRLCQTTASASPRELDEDSEESGLFRGGGSRAYCSQECGAALCEKLTVLGCLVKRTACVSKSWNFDSSFPTTH